MTTRQYTTIATACALLSASCGTSYQNPAKDPAKTAVLRSESTRSGLYTWANYVVEVVDEKPINYLTSWTTASKEIVVRRASTVWCWQEPSTVVSGPADLIPGEAI